MLRNKSQILNSKHLFWSLVIWSLVIVWNLPVCPSGRVLGIWNLTYLYAQEEFTYDARGRRNPFIPLVTSDGRLMKLDKDKEEVKGELSLEGIIYDKHGRSYALVNGSVVAVSDFVGEYQVLKIEQNKVIFIKNGQTTEIELKKEGE